MRSGANETILTYGEKSAADVNGDDVEDNDRLAEDVERVRELLENAPMYGQSVAPSGLSGAVPRTPRQGAAAPGEHECTCRCSAEDSKRR